MHDLTHSVSFSHGWNFFPRRVLPPFKTSISIREEEEFVLDFNKVPDDLKLVLDLSDASVRWRHGHKQLWAPEWHPETAGCRGVSAGDPSQGEEGFHRTEEQPEEGGSAGDEREKDAPLDIRVRGGDHPTATAHFLNILGGRVPDQVVFDNLCPLSIVIYFNTLFKDYFVFSESPETPDDRRKNEKSNDKGQEQVPVNAWREQLK
jgi:hypothetical protein